MTKSRSKRRDEQRTTAPQREQDRDAIGETLTTTGQDAATGGSSPMKMAGLVFGLPFVLLVVLGVLTQSC